MKKIIIYSLLVFILYSGFTEVRTSWNENKEDIGATVLDVSEKASNWLTDMTESGKDLKDALNEKLKVANEKYESMKSDIEETTALVKKKQEQLDQTLKEMEEAKKALDQLLEKEGQETTTDSKEEPASAEENPEEQS